MELLEVFVELVELEVFLFVKSFVILGHRRERMDYKLKFKYRLFYNTSNN